MFCHAAVLSGLPDKWENSGGFVYAQSWRFRPIARVFTVTMVMVSAIVGMTVAANAQTSYPSQCFYDANGGGSGFSYFTSPTTYWHSHNCWMGGTYWTNADAAIDYVQWEVHWATGGTCDAGTIDGTYGTTSTHAVECYQSHRSLTSDGIVGTNTWSALASDTILTACVGVGDCQYHVGRSGASAFNIACCVSSSIDGNWLACFIANNDVVNIDAQPEDAASTAGYTATNCPGIN